MANTESSPGQAGETYQNLRLAPMGLIYHYLLRRQELLNRWAWFRPFSLGRPFLGGDFVLSHSWKRGLIEVTAPLAQAIQQLATGAATPDSGPEHEKVTTVLRELGWLEDVPVDLDAVVAKSQEVFLAIQNPVELREFLELLYERRPKVVVEIGTASGGHFYCLSQVADPSALMISIDFVGGNFGRSTTNVETKLYATFGPPGQRFEFIRQSSAFHSTLTMLKEILGGQEIDLLYLDGDHSYAGIKADYERFEPLVAKDGIIAFHDMLEIPKEVPEWQRGNDISVFWQELKPTVDSREIVDRSFPPADWDGREVRSRIWPPLGIGLVMGNRGTRKERPEGGAQP
jgi:predicted O-methyltransferase YrrM